MQKYYVMAINQHLWNIALNLQSIQEKILPIIFRTVWFTQHLVDWVSADYIGYYMQGYGKLDKYGFSLAPAWYVSNEVRRVFNFLPKFKNLSQFLLQIVIFKLTRVSGGSD